MNNYEKPLAMISIFETEEVIMASNMKIEDENNELGWGSLQ